jgi:hypothetical protein
MAVGFPAKTDFATGEVLTATNMNDITGTLNLLESAEYAAGKNKIINGDFGIWQRGTTFTNVTDATYTADRWMARSSNNTIDVTRSTFTPGTAPVAGYEGTYFATLGIEAADTEARLEQRIENSRTFAGQTISISFWAKSNITTDAIRFIRVVQVFGVSSPVTTTTPTAITLTSSWARYSVTVAVPSVAGKTITAGGGYLGISIDAKQSAAQTLDIWGVQAEAASTVSDFQTASGTLAGELALCQRYYYDPFANNATGSLSIATAYSANSTTIAYANLPLPVTMNKTPTMTVTAASFSLGYPGAVALTALTALATLSNILLTCTTSGMTANASYSLYRPGTTASLALSAEL